VEISSAGRVFLQVRSHCRSWTRRILQITITAATPMTACTSSGSRAAMCFVRVASIETV
jgi:hypothetical protein